MYPEETDKNANEQEMESSPFDQPIPQALSPMDAAQGIIQQHGKKIIKGIIALVVLIFLYNFFIGSLVKVTIEARDTEGRIVAGIKGSLYEGSSNSPFHPFSGNTTLDLRPGEYRVEWNVSGTPYKDPGENLFTVESGNGPQTEKTTLERNSGVSVSSLSFPSTLVVGQTNAIGTLTLENKTSKQETVELAFDGDLDPNILDIQTQPTTLTIPGGQTVNVQLTISVPTNTVVKNPKSGDPKKGNIRVKYTLNGKEARYTLFKAFAFDVNPKTPQTFSATANKLFTKTFTLRNSNTVDSSEGIQTEISIKSTQANSLNQIAGWFDWSPSPPFAPLKKGETDSVQMQLLAPPSAGSDIITGEITFFTGFWSQIVPFTLNLTEAKVELDVTLDGSATLKQYTLSQDASGQFETRTTILKLENEGALAIENILMEVQGCEQYIMQTDPNFFLSLKLAEKGKSGSSKTTTLQITAPASALPGDTKTCLLQINYLDPKTNDVVQHDPITVEIET